MSVIEAPDFYDDRDAWLKAVAPLSLYMQEVARLGDVYTQTSLQQAEVGECLLAWLVAWASNRALLGDIKSVQGHHERQWAVGGLAIVFGKIEDDARLDADGRSVVRDWIHELGQVVREDYDALRDNHAYWAGLQVLASGIVSDDATLVEWGIQRFFLALDQMRPDGILPLELARGSTGFFYQDFSLVPLVFIAELAMRQGMDLYTAEGGKIHRLANLVITTLDDPRTFERYTDVPQTFQPSPHDLSWMEPYYARFADPRLVSWIESARETAAFVDYRVGGDATINFGAPALP